jgi:outer membrane protein TolC
VRAQEIALDGVKQEALVGTRTVLDVLDAEQELLNARVDLVRAQRDEVVASLSLASAVGLLSAEALNLDVPRYDVQEHYQRVRGKWLGTGVGSPWRPVDK